MIQPDHSRAVDVDVVARNVLGSYTATVTNNSPDRIHAVCQVEALDDDGRVIGKGEFSVDLDPLETKEHRGKVGIPGADDWARAFRGTCFTAD